jgi:hypothetical protein
MEQRSDEWFLARRGKFTSSQIYRLTTEPKSKEAKEKGELSEGARTYILECIAESIGGEIPKFSSMATERGNELEPQAKIKYAYETGNKVFGISFIEKNEYYGGSPDAKVEEGDIIGGLEIKCPFNSSIHLEHCLISSAEYFKANFKEYYWQCVSHINLMDVAWCDFVSYDPRINHDKCFHVFRLHRDEKELEFLNNKIQKAIEVKQELIKQLGL